MDDTDIQTSQVKTKQAQPSALAKHYLPFLPESARTYRCNAAYLLHRHLTNCMSAEHRPADQRSTAQH